MLQCGRCRSDERLGPTARAARLRQPDAKIAVRHHSHAEATRRAAAKRKYLAPDTDKPGSGSAWRHPNLQGSAGQPRSKAPKCASKARDIVGTLNTLRVSIWVEATRPRPVGDLCFCAIKQGKTIRLTLTIAPIGV
jgi:hypothetical protein